jgi:regulator of replication initiation timing
VTQELEAVREQLDRVKHQWHVGVNNGGVVGGALDASLGGADEETFKLRMENRALKRRLEEVEPQVGMCDCLRAH